MIGRIVAAAVGAALPWVGVYLVFVAPYGGNDSPRGVAWWFAGGLAIGGAVLLAVCVAFAAAWPKD